MSTAEKVNRQGSNTFGEYILYVAWCPPTDVWYYQKVYYGTPITSYDRMDRVTNKALFFIHADPILLQHFTPGTVVSDLYPELFI